MQTYVGIPAVADRPRDSNEQKRDKLKETEVEDEAFGNGVRGLIADRFQLGVVVGREVLRERHDSLLGVAGRRYIRPRLPEQLYRRREHLPQLGHQEKSL